MYSSRTPNGYLHAGGAIFVFAHMIYPLQHIDYKQLSIA